MEYFGNNNEGCDDFGLIWSCIADAEKSIYHKGLTGHVYRPINFPENVERTTLEVGSKCN
jgi:hypothetical protein